MKIERVEPLSWWAGMHTPLQLMFYGKGLQDAEVRCLEKGLMVLKVHQAESKNYLFVDILVEDYARPGTYTFEFTQGKKKIKHSYIINARSEGSAQRKGFGPADMIYLIMPDRFANGNPENDNHKDAAEKANRDKPYGRHGGDIQGMINHLDYLQELGVTAIWPTPLLFDNEPRASYHGYACADYYRIDPRYGTNELYKQMVEMARERGIKFIMDMVPNHCGMAHWWMKDLPFASWIHQFPEFTRSNYQMASHFDPNASKYDNDLCVKGWFDTSMPDMNLTNLYVLNYFTQMAVWWIEFAGLDGLRVDTYPYSDKHAMATWTKNILDEYPHLNIVGEAWYPSPSMIAYWEGAAKNTDGYTCHLPSVMDFPLQENIAAGFAKDSMPSWGEGLMKIYSCLTQDFVYVQPNNLMIFIDNHDINRMAWLLKGKKDKQKMVMALLATMRGVPQLTYGSEVMLYNKNKQGHGEERLDMPGGWPDDERSVFTAAGRTKTENEVFEYTKKLFNWRKNTKVIHEGKLMQFVPVDNNFYVYFRYTDKELVMMAINNCREEKTIDWPRFSEITTGYAQGVDIITGNAVQIDSPLSLPPQQALVVHFKK
jgi:glycosidase